MPKKDNWIQKANSGHNKGALHRQLGIPEDRKIPTQLLQDIVDTPLGKRSHGHSVTWKLKSRANFALNVRKNQRKK